MFPMSRWTGSRAEVNCTCDNSLLHVFGTGYHEMLTKIVPNPMQSKIHLSPLRDLCVSSSTALEYFDCAIPLYQVQ
jgi:hypothetical protein